MLKKRGIVDEANIAVTGWSYGGYMTSWLSGHAQFWKAAIAGAPMTNWLDTYNLSDGNVIVSASVFGWSPYTAESMKHYVAQSPVTYYEKMTTPTLILHDVGDYRVPITQGYELFHALKDRGVRRNSMPIQSAATPRQILSGCEMCTGVGLSGWICISHTTEITKASLPHCSAGVGTYRTNRK
jgi:dienelactone hydrolase